MLAFNWFSKKSHEGIFVSSYSSPPSLGEMHTMIVGVLELSDEFVSEWARIHVVGSLNAEFAGLVHELGFDGPTGGLAVDFGRGSCGS